VRVTRDLPKIVDSTSPQNGLGTISEEEMKDAERLGSSFMAYRGISVRTGG